MFYLSTTCTSLHIFIIFLKQLNLRKSVSQITRSTTTAIRIYKNGNTCPHTKSLFFSSYFSKKVKENSTIYKKLLQLNKKYDLIFDKNIKEKIKYSKLCNSKKEFENADLNKVLTINIESEIDSLTKLITQIQQNKIINKTKKQKGFEFEEIQFKEVL